MLKDTRDTAQQLARMMATRAANGNSGSVVALPALGEFFVAEGPGFKVSAVGLNLSDS